MSIKLKLLILRRIFRIFSKELKIQVGFQVLVITIQFNRFIGWIFFSWIFYRNLLPPTFKFRSTDLFETLDLTRFFGNLPYVVPLNLQVPSLVFIIILNSSRKFSRILLNLGLQIIFH